MCRCNLVYTLLIGVLLMSRGAPDYNQIQTQTVNVELGQINQNVFDIGFARLDGGGRVLFFDDFRRGANRYNLLSDAGGSLPVLVDTVNHQHGFAGTMKLDPVIDTGVSEMDVDFVSPVSGRYALEAGFYLEAHSGVMDLYIKPRNDTGSGYVFGVRVIEETRAVQVYTSTGFQTVFTASALQEFATIHMALKFVCDLTTGKYVRLYFGAQKIDLSSYTASGPNFGASGRVSVQALFTGSGATYVDEGYIDYVIISADEP